MLRSLSAAGGAARWRAAPHTHYYYTSMMLLRRAHFDTPTTQTLLHALRAGFAARDLDQVWDAWNALREQGELRRLQRHDEADVLALVRAHLAALAPRARSQRTIDTRNDAWKARCYAWGARAAERMDVLGVQGWMKVELLCGNATGAIHIFSAYVAARRAARGDQTLFLDGQGRRARQIHDLLELLILCYAYNSDLSGMVRMFQSFDVGTHTELFFDLAHCRRQYAKFPWQDPMLDTVRERALEWVSHAELARGLQGGTGGRGGHNRIARLLGSLLARGDVPSVWRLTHAAMDGGVWQGNISVNDCAWLAQEQLAHGAQLPCWTDSCWTVCLSGFLAAQRADLAAQLWTAVAALQRRLGSSWPPPAVWNALLDGHSRSGDYEAVAATWRVMTKAMPPHELPLVRGGNGHAAVVQPVPPDLLCYTTMIAASFRAQQVAVALDLFAELQAQQRDGKVAIPVETYNAVVHGLCVVRHMSDAQALVASMGQDGVPPPTITTINVLLRAQARQKQLGAMADTLRNILPLGLRPDVITFTTVLDALLRSATTPERAEAAVERVMHIMASMHVTPNSVTFTAMIKACLHTRGDEPPRLHVALQLLQTMCTTTKLAPNVITFATVIPGVLQHAEMVGALGAARQVPMLLARVPAPMASLGEDEATVEHAFPLDTPAAGARVALVCWELMNSYKLAPTCDMYHVMLRALLANPHQRHAFLRGILLADELMRARGALATAAGVRETSSVPSMVPEPVAASWTALLNALLNAHRQAARSDADMVRAVLRAALVHYSSSEKYGAPAISSGTFLPRLSRLLADAASLVK